jgi:hypothetical protein
MRCVRYLVAALFLASAGAAQADQDTSLVWCKDGSKATAGPGACEYNGGMAKEEGAPVPTKVTPASLDSDEAERVAPTTVVTPSPAEVRCKDGTLALVEPGACSRNGGISKGSSYAPMAAPGAIPSPPAEKESQVHNPKAELTTNPPTTREDDRPTARCKDGTYAVVTHHSATCAGHGGVEQ